ncbi:MAG: hypothetical protein E7680_06005 [Ruminococcaceae bacterium]|nr:hypothetical protein [Oscillospiraceae bacterium]
MGFGKLFILLFCAVFVVVFFSAKGKISDLNEKTNELKTAVQQTASTLNEWKDRIFNPPAVATQTTPEPSPTDDPLLDNLSADEKNGQTTEEAADFSCILRTSDGKIGIFTTDGYLIRTLNVDLRTLPESDLSALEAGISILSRAELLERIEDFGG